MILYHWFYPDQIRLESSYLAFDILRWYYIIVTASFRDQHRRRSPRPWAPLVRLVTGAEPPIALMLPGAHPYFPCSSCVSAHSDCLQQSEPKLEMHSSVWVALSERGTWPIVFLLQQQTQTRPFVSSRSHAAAVELRRPSRTPIALCTSVRPGRTASRRPCASLPASRSSSSPPRQMNGRIGSTPPGKLAPLRGCRRPWPRAPSMPPLGLMPSSPPHSPSASYSWAHHGRWRRFGSWGRTTHICLSSLLVRKMPTCFGYSVGGCVFTVHHPFWVWVVVWVVCWRYPLWVLWENYIFWNYEYLT